MQIMTKENYIVTAMHSYDNPSCHSIEEFKEDLNRIKYIKRLLNRYIKTKKLKERLILNHLIIFTNMFGNEMAVKMLFFKLKPELWSALKTFCILLHIMPEVITGLEKPIYSNEIPVDVNIANILRKI